ncbi:tryptophanase [Spirillospora sp. NPDC050679]
MEPYRIKVVEALPMTDRTRRETALREAGHNVFGLSSQDVTIDLLTDSGTSAMSAAQWSALMHGDEAYAGSGSFERFESVVRDLTGHRHVFPVHQGRGAERVLFNLLVPEGGITVSNDHFDTTMANVRLAGGETIDIPCPESLEPDSDFPFQGNLDLPRLEELLDGPKADRIAAVILTIPDNAGGGHPVAIDHMVQVRGLCRAHGIPLLLDAARFAENAHLVSVRDPARAGASPRQIAEEVFRLADASWSSLKKDAFGNIGAFLTVNDDDLAERCRDQVIATEGFRTYGGLSGRDLDALARGLLEATDPAHLAHREQTARWLADALADAGVPVLRPPGCHAVYLDARALLPDHKPQDLPGVAVACALYLEGGVRAAEMGTLAFGGANEDGPDTAAPRELVRLALPRRVYTRSHLEYVVETAQAVARRAEELPAYSILSQPAQLRHFTARLEPSVRK